MRDVRQKFVCHLSAMLGSHDSTEDDENAMLDAKENEILYTRLIDSGYDFECIAWVTLCDDIVVAVMQYYVRHAE